MKLVLGIFCLLLFTSTSSSQTCCSGGVPVSANLGFQAEETKVTQLSLSADFNVLRTLKAGSETLQDDDRLRTTQSYILRAAHTWTPRLTTEVFLPLVRQTRRITSPTGSIDNEETFGIGDPVALLIYTVTNNKWTWRIGAGPQIPLGSSTQTNDRGLTLLEDLQPGSGAWDLVAMSSAEVPLKSRPSGLVYLNVIYSATGTNNNARSGRQTYEFGNDVQTIIGYSDQLLIGKSIIQPGLSLRYRHANPDQVNSSDLPGTGGDFVFARFSNAFPIGKGNSSFNINFEVPLWSQVNDTQLAPSYVINIGWYHRISHTPKDAPTFDQLIN